MHWEISHLLKTKNQYRLYAFIGVVDSYAENFMTGYRVVFDREKLVLGWKKFDCKGCFHMYSLPRWFHTMASVSNQACWLYCRLRH